MMNSEFQSRCPCREVAATVQHVLIRTLDRDRERPVHGVPPELRLIDSLDDIRSPQASRVTFNRIIGSESVDNG